MTDHQNPFELLLEVQEEDIRHDQLRHQIDNHPLLAQIAALHEQSVSIDGSTRAQRMERDAYIVRQSEIEDKVRDLDRRVGEINDRLRSDSSGSFRDQAAMSKEMNSLIERKRTLEDEELELMELIEPLEALLNRAHETQQRLHSQARADHEAMTKERRELMIQLDEIVSQRNALALSVPESLLNEYNRLRARLGGIGAARLVHGMCSGCNLALSATEVDRLRHVNAMELVHCDQCGRILVP
ncbi:MAG TPA: C4-type zinc ribbon domain-containing protein [Acidimicrobiales bacterium]|nr:C4-type zinc ribbon domain-containing protein [Acidimicrobiales bacterium]